MNFLHRFDIAEAPFSAIASSDPPRGPRLYSNLRTVCAGECSSIREQSMDGQCEWGTSE